MSCNSIVGAQREDREGRGGKREKEREIIDAPTTYLRLLSRLLSRLPHRPLRLLLPPHLLPPHLRQRRVLNLRI